MWGLIGSGTLGQKGSKQVYVGNARDTPMSVRPHPLTLVNGNYTKLIHSGLLMAMNLGEKVWVTPIGTGPSPGKVLAES